MTDNSSILPEGSSVTEPGESDLLDLSNWAPSVEQLKKELTRAEETVDPDLEEPSSILENFLTFGQMLNIEPKRYLVKHWLDLDSLARIYAPSGAGKSFFALDLAVHVALGKTWYGNRVKQGPVIYFAAEGASGMRYRAKALIQKHGTTDIPDFYLFSGAITIAERSDGRLCLATNWIDFVSELADSNELNPSLIILDTQARMTIGMEENSAQDMGMMIRGLDKLRTATGACVLLVHHTGHNETDRARGSSSVTAAMDHEFSLKRLDRSSLTVEPRKQKDHAEAGPIGLRAVVIEVDTDEDGDPISSIYLEHAPEIGALDLNAARKDALRELLAKSPEGLSKQAIEKAIQGKAEDTRKSLKELVDAGMIEVRKGSGRGGAHLHFLSQKAISS